MKAITFDSPGGPEVLKVGEYEKPVPSEKEILVKVQATAINRADTLTTNGEISPAKRREPGSRT